MNFDSLSILDFYFYKNLRWCGKWVNNKILINQAPHAPGSHGPPWEFIPMPKYKSEFVASPQRTNYTYSEAFRIVAMHSTAEQWSENSVF